MSWYYAEDGKQFGPLADAQFDALVHSGKVQSETLVWREGMENWKPYREVAPPAFTDSLTAPPVGMLGADEAACAECGRVFSKDLMIHHGDLWVCANCKPVFLQKLSEGAPLASPSMRFAGFWIRFGAVIIDGLLLGVVNMAIALILGLAMGQSLFLFQPGNPQQIGRFIIFEAVLIFFQLAVGVTYETLMVGKYGATLGKMACGVKVVTAEGEPVTYLRAFGRYFAKLLSYMICYIGCIMAGFDQEKRGLHDLICNTRVVYR